MNLLAQFSMLNCDTASVSVPSCPSFPLPMLVDFGFLGQQQSVTDGAPRPGPRHSLSLGKAMTSLTFSFPKVGVRMLSSPTLTLMLPR